MSSDIDEFAEEAELGSPSGARGGDDEFGGGDDPGSNGGGGRQRHHSGQQRRCSLPSDRPSTAIRRHLQQFKTRRKISAPSAPAPPLAPLPAFAINTGGSTSTPNKSSAVASSPLETMSGYPLSELLERLRPAAADSSSTSTTASRQASISTDSGVTDSSSGGGRRYSDAYSYRSGFSSSPGRTNCSLDEGFQSGMDETTVRTPLFVDTRLANTALGNGGGPATVPWRCLYSRQASVAGVPDEPTHFPRQRSNSEAGRYLLMRKCTDYRSEFVGKLEEGEWAYCQILATLKCYDLMPSMAKMIVFDSSLSIGKAFSAFVQNNIRAAPIWDNQKKLFVGLLTVTDLMHMLVEYTDPKSAAAKDDTSTTKRAKTFDELLECPLHSRLFSAANIGNNQQQQRKSNSPVHFFGANNHHQPYHLNHLIYALADETVAKAAKTLCDRRLHRLLILDPNNGGNPLFLLSKKDVLKALRTYIAKLPLPSCMEKTLDELLIGTWSDLTTVTQKTTIHRCLSLFVSRGFSALPIVDGDYRIVDMLTKVDVLNLVVENHGPTDGILQKSVEDAIRMRPSGAEKMTTCSKKASMMLAVECILHSGAHRLAIVDSDGRLEGMLSLADLMRFLTSGFSPNGL